jgi:hypothetical protein
MNLMKALYSLLTGEAFKFYVGGGSPAPQQQPTNQTVTQTNLPAWAQPYSEQLLGQAQALTDVNTNPYQTYTGQRLADFTPMQQQAFSNIGNMGVSQQTGQATGLAGLAGLGSLGAGANYMDMATNPAATQAFMSPYQQNVTDWQKQQAIMDYGRALPGMGAQAAQAGAFGGSRQALQQSEAQRNLQNQLAGIQAQGSQAAFNAAQQAQQFGANLGLQGYGQAGQLASTLGQLGQQQYGQQMGINAAQQQAGAQQQAMQQQGLTNAYQDFLNRQNYPYQQLAFMSDILHGTPTGGITTSQQYQAAPSMANQIMGYGLGAYGLSKMFGKEGGAVPSGLKKYAKGGEVKYAAGGSIEGQYQLALKMGIPRLQQIISGQEPSEIPPVVAAAAMRELQQAQVAAQGMQAQQELARDPGTVLDRMKAQQLPQEAGVEALNTDNLNDVVEKASGGIIGYDTGGEVDRYNIASGETWLGQGIQRSKAALKDIAGLLTLQPWQTDPERVAQGDFRTNAEVEGYTPSGYAVNERTDELKKRLAAQQAAQPKTPVSSAPTSSFDPMNPWARVGLPAAVASASPTAIPTPQMSPRRDMAAQFTQQTPPPKTTRRVATSAAPKGEPQIVLDPSVQRPMPEPTGIETLAPAPKQQAPAFGLPEALTQMQDITKGYTDKQAELIKSLTPSAEEKEKQGNERKAIMALKAAGEFLKPGVPGTAARLGNIGSGIAELATQYSKEDKEDKRTALAAQISLLGSQAQLAQGNAKSAVDLFQHGEKLTYQYANLEAEREFRRVEQELKKQGLSDEKVYRDATIAAKNRELDIMAQYRKDWARITEGKGANRGALTQAQSAAIQQRAQVQVDKEFKDNRFLADYKKQYPGFSDVQLRQQRLNEKIRSLKEHNMSYDLGAFDEGGGTFNPYYSNSPPEGAGIVDMRSR